MAFLVCLFLFIVRTSSVCLVLNFHPKTDAETKLQRRTQSPKAGVSVASRYREMLRKEQRGERLCKRLHRIANTCTLFLRGICKRELSLAREPPKDAE